MNSYCVPFQGTDSNPSQSGSVTTHSSLLAFHCPSAFPPRAEGGTIGLALGGGLLILDTDAVCTAAAVDGVEFAGRYVAAHAGIWFIALVFHGRTSFSGLRP